MRVAVITPYYREDLDTLRRCHDSVLRQTYPCTHIFVADGHPQQEIYSWKAQHFSMAVSHGDYGDTPRGIGSISAFNQGFDAVAYLDADNWYAEDHIESLVRACSEHDLAVAFSSRRIVLSTGEHCPFVDSDEVDGRHVDTSCFFITAKAAFVASLWAMMDPRYSVIGDRLLLHVVKARGLRHGWTGQQTLYYESRWRVHFEAMGKAPPPDAHSIDLSHLSEPYSPEKSIARLGFDPLS